MRLHYLLFIISLSAIQSLSAQQTQLKQAHISLVADATPAQVRDVALYHFSDILGKKSSLKLLTENGSPAARYFHFAQTWQGKEIHRRGIKLRLGRDGRIDMIFDFLQHNFVPASQTAFTFSLASARIRTARIMGTFDMQIEQQYFPQTQDGSDIATLIPVYRIWAFSHNKSESYELLLDGRDGKELLRTDRVARFGHRCLGDTTGRARVFLPNPTTKAELMYGTSFQDNNDQHLAIFDGLMDTVVLQDIRYDSDTFFLEGPYVKILDLNPRDVTPVRSADGDFFFDRNESGFEDVMCYYHIDTFQRYIQSLGYSGLWGQRPLSIDPHGRGNSDNSSFVPNGHSSYILMGEGGVDDAEDADVIIHEYGHALAYAGSPNTRVGTERRGMEEGFGDYFAAAYSYDIKSHYGWDLVMNWDGHNTYWGGRVANSPQNYTAGIGDIYDLGRIWASAMMEIRQRIGSKESDRLHLELLYALVPAMSMPQAARVILSADSLLYGAAHSQDIIDIFCRRNFFSGSECFAVGIEKELYFQKNWYAYPNPNQGEIFIKWNLSVPQSKMNLIIYDLLGREIKSLNATASTAKWSFRLPQGVYFLKMYVKGEWAGVQKLSVEF